MSSPPSRPTLRKRQSILDVRKSDSEGVLLLKLNGKECGSQKQHERQDESNREKSGESG
jgi:hypothetical protein